MTKTAIVPVAGLGTRLGKLRFAFPKCLMPYQGVPAIDHVLEMLSLVGVKNVVLVVGWKKEAVISYLEDGSAFNMNIAYVVQNPLRGIGDAVLRAEPFVGDEFYVLLGDTIFYPKDALKVLESPNEVMVTVVTDYTKHGMVECVGNRIKQIVEKPRKWSGENIGSCGAYFFDRKIFKAIRKTYENPLSGELELTDAINTLAKEEDVRIRAFEGEYVDMGKLEE